MITGNRGEWSELYVLLRLLADGKLYAANEDLEKINVYNPILQVLRKEVEDFTNAYKISGKTVTLYINGDKIKTVTSSWLDNAAKEILSGITGERDKDRAFRIPASVKIMDELHLTKIKAKSGLKKDIEMEVRDTQTGINTLCGFSIKSDLGMPPTLLNASKQTNFVYSLQMSDADAKYVNSIKRGRKIKARMEYIKSHGGVKFEHMISDQFKENVSYIDSLMDDILGEIVRISFMDDITSCADLVTEIEKKDPIGFHKEGLYRYKFKKFLCSVALGMMPSKSWNGRDEANGGYIIVKESGDVVAYYLYNRDNFETYLLNNTKFERAATGRHDYATIYEDKGKKYINLNMQIRFT